MSLGEGEPGLDGQQFGVGSRQLNADHSGVKDPDLVADGLNQHQVDAFGRFGVETVRVDEQAQGLVERAAHGIDLDSPLGNDSLSCLGFVLMRSLFQLELVKRQSVVVVRFLGFRTFVLEPGEAFALAGNFGLALGVAALEVSQDDIFQRLDTVFGQLNREPVVGDGLLDVSDRDVALRTTVLIFLAAEAVEVGIGLAGALLGRGGDSEPAAAASAEEAALQVVGAGLGFVFVKVPGGQDGVHRVERRLVDERLVVAGVLDAAVGDDTEVVAVVQDAVHLLGLQGSFGQALGSGQPQAEVVGFVGKVTDGVKAGGVAAEAVSDDRPGHRVNHDNADVLAGEFHPLVHVTERCFAGCATRLDLLPHALLGLFAQVPGVPLRDGRHDAVHQLAGRGFVDVLGGGHELDAVLGEEETERDVIFTAAGQAVELVNDDVADLAVFLDAAEQALEFGPVSRAGALASVDELVHDARRQFSGFALAVVALGLDGKSLIVEAGIGLFAGGDAVVGQGLSQLLRAWIIRGGCQVRFVRITHRGLLSR